MIRKQFVEIRNDGVRLYITFSDCGYFIEKKSQEKKERYKWAIDVETVNYEYQETDKLIEHTAMQVWQMETLGVKYWIPSMADVKVK